MPRPNLDVILMDRYTRKAIRNYAVNQDVIKLNFSGKKPNVNNDLEKIEEILGHEIHPLILDLYNIALTTYMADLLISRPKKTGCRTINILVSVSNLIRWNSIKNDLEATLRLLSGDDFVFHFVKGRRSKEFNFALKDKRPVSLFSGGLDSFTGTKWFFDRGIDPVLVSHCGQNKLCSVQSSLSEKINKLFGKNIDFYQILARAKLGKNLAQNEYTQRARSFLFLSIASLFALELGSNEIFVFENGVLAINIPITQGRIYGNTRTTHPDFLARFSNLIIKLFAVELTIQNPFLYMTKGEVVSMLNDNSGFKDLINETISCSHQGRLRFKRVKLNKVSHCGECVPCALRRTAMRAANLDSYDAKYNVDISKQTALNDDAERLYFELKDFSNKINSYLTDTDVLLHYPQFYVESADVHNLIEMYRRYCKEIDSLLTNNP